TKYYGPAAAGTAAAASGEQMSIYEAAMKYQKDNVPLVILAGHEYGTGSSRDWAAKGTRLLGVKAVIAASFERIHRSNLVGMGVLPLQFPEDTNAQTLSLDGSEKFSITGLSDSIEPGETVTLEIERKNEKCDSVPVRLRIDTPIELDDYQKVAIKSLREQRGFARNENVVIATCYLVVIEQCVTVIPAVCIKTGVQRLLAWLGRQP